MSKPRPTRVGKMIREARIEKGYSQTELGKMLGYGYGNFLTQIENGKSPIPYSKIPLICDLLDLDPRMLLKEVMSIRDPEMAKYL